MMLEKLNLIREAVKTSETLDRLFEVIVSQLACLLSADTCSLFLIDHGRDAYVLRASHGLDHAAVDHLCFSFNEGLIGSIAHAAEPINLADWHTDLKDTSFSNALMEGWHGFLGVPLHDQTRLVGLLILQREVARRFDDEEVGYLLTLTPQIAEAIVESQTREMLKDKQRSSILKGIPASFGVAIGKAVVMYPASDLDAVPERVADDIDEEIKSLKKALVEAQKELEQLSQRLVGRLSEEERGLFRSYIQILASPSFYKEVVSIISKGQWAQWALCEVVRSHIAQFEAISNPYLRERASDFRDLGCRVLFYLQTKSQEVRDYPKKTILVGEEVTAASLAEVPEGHLAGIVSVRGSSNSHVAILARALGVPAVMGVEHILVLQMNARTVIVDGYYGQVYLSPSEKICREFVALAEEERELDRDVSQLRDLPAETTDGHRLSLYVNTGIDSDIHRAHGVGAEGVGLHRSEIPFMSMGRFPTEEEQRVIYRQLLNAFTPRPVVIRTLDIGGDKLLPYLPMNEKNPFLGWRGIRVSLEQPRLFLTQLRAMLRANLSLGNLHIMFPMVSHMEQLEEALSLVNQAYASVRDNHPAVQKPRIGIMIEVPSAVYQVEAFIQRVDFVSVGSNDLIQYLLAVDRNNSRVAGLYDCFHPAVLKALMHVVSTCHRYQKSVSICGEMAGNPLAVVLLMAMQFDTLSVSANRLPRVKWVIRRFSMEKAKQLLEDVLGMQHTQLIQQHLEFALESVGLGGLIRAGRS